MRRAMKLIGFAVLALAVCAVGWPSDAAAQRKFSFAYDQPTTTAYGIAANIFRMYPVESVVVRKVSHGDVPLNDAVPPGQSGAVKGLPSAFTLPNTLKHRRTPL